MAEMTSHDEEMSRSEAAAMLRSFADELDSGSGVVSMPVGNKNVKLSPPDEFVSEVRVTERSRRLRKDVETVVVEFEWNPTKATAEAEPDTGSGAESGSEDTTSIESPSEPESDPGVER